VKPAGLQAAESPRTPNASYLTRFKKENSNL
jgi:hypothetical protein